MVLTTFKKRYIMYFISLAGILLININNFRILIEETKPALFGSNTSTTIGITKSVILPYLNGVDSDTMYEVLLKEAQAAMEKNSSMVLHSMEVGMHSAEQCLLQAKYNSMAHCVEPSPASVKRIHRKISNAPEAQRKKVKFYQLAASDRSGIDLEFTSRGGTGDYVGDGEYDVWEMIRKKTTTKDKKVVTKSAKTVVRSVAIDDIIDNKVGPSIDYAEVKGETSASMPSIDRIFLLKVDTQGHEPSVFSGLQKSIREHKIDMILTEYWPKGIDFMNDNMGTEKECKMAVSMLQRLVNAGYTLFSLSMTCHPKAPWDLARKKKQDIYEGKVTKLPWNTLREHCMWFYDLERKYRDTGGIMANGKVYKMGYWTDILAVRPGFTFPVAPQRKWAKIIANHS